MWLLKILRILFGFIDSLIYKLINIAYVLFINIAEAGIFTQETIQTFATRIYVILGVVMLFKVSISLVTYILNPDNFSKGDVGAPALIKGFIFALVGIVLVPYVFEMAYSLQRIVLRDNIIPNLILGMSASNSNSVANETADAGNTIAFTTFTAFYRINDDIQVSDECLVLSSSNYENCLDGLLETDLINTVGSAYQDRSISQLVNLNVIGATVTDNDGEEIFVFGYLFFVSTLAGGFIAYIFILFCFDIAIRSVKLSFLQLIAPIPLIARIDPKKGSKTFDNWLSECVTTYIDVFVRLIAIYFSVFVIISIVSDPVTNMTTQQAYTGFTGLLVQVFIIIGALSFAQKLPELLGKVLGIDLKGMGGFTLNPKKKVSQVPLIGNKLAQGVDFAGRVGKATGKTLGGLGKLGVGAGAGLLGNKFANSQLGINAAKAGRWAANTSPIKKIGSAGQSVGSVLRSGANWFADTPAGEVVKDNFGDLGEQASAILGSKNLAKFQKVTSAVDSFENRMKEKIINNEAGDLSIAYHTRLAEIKKMEDAGYDSQKIAEAKMELNKWLGGTDDNGALSLYYKSAKAGTLDSDFHFSDGGFEGAYKNYAAAVRSVGEKAEDDLGKIHGHGSKYKGKTSDVQRYNNGQPKGN